VARNFAAWVVAAALAGLIFSGRPPALGLAAEVPAKDAQALIQEGHWKRARAILEPEFKAHLQDPRLFYLLAQLKMAFQDFDGALPLAQHAVEMDANNSDFHLKLGQVYGELAARASVFSAGSLAVKFRKEVETAINLNPRNLEALDSMMQFKFQAPGLMGGDKNEARALAEKITLLNPSEGYLAKAELAGLEKNPAEVEACLLKAVEANPQSYAARIELGRFYSQSPHAKYDEGAKQARYAIKIGPEQVGGYWILARVAALQEQWSDVEQTLAASEKDVPDDLRPYFEAAESSLETGKDISRAEAFARKYLSQEPEGGEPDLAEAHRLLGLLLDKEGRNSEARGEMQTALRLRPNFKAAKDDLKKIGN